MNNQIAIALNAVGKKYRIYKKPQHRLYNSISNVFIRSNSTTMHNVANSKFYTEFWALKNISVQIYKGETVGIVGRNGSGKSTLLQIVSKVLASNTGSIETTGRIAALLELGAGFNPEYTGRENIITNATILGLSQSQIKEKMDEIIEFSELNTFIDQPIKTYSSGMYVRLAFSIAINTEPEILIIDEALAVGDEAFQRKCFSKIHEFKKRQGTILFVSHNASLVVELCDRAVLLENGEMLTIGQPKNIVSYYQKLIYSNSHDEANILTEIKNNTLDSDRIDNQTSTVSFSELTEDFDASLKPTSTIHYENYNVFINDAYIKTLDNKKVNILVPRNDYIFCYNIKFNEDVHNIRLGMLIKTITGLELGGATNTSFCSPIKFVEENTIINIEFKFKCLLNKGTYFMNAGVTSKNDGKDSFLARTIDILMFKVKEQDRIQTTGTIDFLITSKINIDKLAVA